MRLAAALIVALSLAAVIPAIAHNGNAGSARNGTSTVDPNAANVQIGGPFTLTDGNNKPFTEANLLGKYSLVFFGFTFCPDICPTELQNALVALDLAGADATAQTNIVFISIDPERDTPSKVNEYVRQFSDSIIGLTGTPEQIAAVARAYKIYYARSAESEPDDTESYMMDHSSFLYLMGPDGKYITVFRASTDPQEIANTLKAEIATHR